MPVVCACGQDAKHVLGADDRDGEALPRTIDGRRNQQTARRDVPRGGSNDRLDVGNVFDHFEQEHHVETLVRPQRRFRVPDPVVDRHALARGMDARRRNVFRGGIDARDLRAAPRKRLAQQAGAASDVQDAQPGEVRGRGAGEVPGHQPTQVRDPQFVDDVQRTHRPGAVPPGRTEPVEPFDLRRDDRHRESVGAEATLAASRAGGAA